jgi:hypothetical protein
MSQIKRYIPVSELKEQDFPWNSEFAEEVSNEVVDSGRWMAYHELVVKMADDGLHYMVQYQTGLTEHQDTSYEDRWFEDPVEFVRVEQVPVTVLQWKPVEQ